MLKAPKSSLWALIPVTGISVAMTLTLITSGSPLDRECRGSIRGPRVAPGSFPEPQVRRSLNGLLRTTLHACIATNDMLDQNSMPPQIVKIQPPTFEGRTVGPTLLVRPRDGMTIFQVNDLPGTL